MAKVFGHCEGKMKKDETLADQSLLEGTLKHSAGTSEILSVARAANSCREKLSDWPKNLTGVGFRGVNFGAQHPQEPPCDSCTRFTWTSSLLRRADV